MEGENRIKSMALIHEKLYSSKNLSTVDFKEYIHSLTTTLFIAYKINSSKISLNIDIKNVALGIDMAVPCGLLLNELISNSLKHGFKDGRTGEIFVGMCYISDGRIELIVRDNGVGIPKDIDIRNTESLGWQLIIGLGESQLGGKIEVNIENGTEIKVRFSDNIKTNQLV
jgi:two-component sensor histidine kinase